MKTEDQSSCGIKLLRQMVELTIQHCTWYIADLNVPHHMLLSLGCIVKDVYPESKTKAAFGGL